MAHSVSFLPGAYRPAGIAAAAALGAGAFALSSMAEGKGSSAGFLALFSTIGLGIGDQPANDCEKPTTGYQKVLGSQSKKNYIGVNCRWHTSD